MEQIDLLKNEIVERSLSPHPLSFVKLQSLCVFLIVWGILVWWLVSLSDFQSILGSNPWYPIIVWGLVLLLVGVGISLVTVQWSIFFMYLGVFLTGLTLIIWQNWVNSVDTVSLSILAYSAVASIAGFLIVEIYRRSHKYVITNLRIIFKGGILTKQERIVRYDKISDINTKQGIFGQLFGFGTIIPISQSGFGLGADKTLAAGGVAVGGKKAKAIGLAGGGREVQIPRARSYYELHGVFPFKEIKNLIENLVQSTVITPYQQEQVQFQKEQVEIQKQMRDLMKVQTRKTRKKPVTAAILQAEELDDEDEVDEPEPPIDDVQKQMQDLLKKQRIVQGKKIEEPSEDEEEFDDELPSTK